MSTSQNTRALDIHLTNCDWSLRVLAWQDTTEAFHTQEQGVVVVMSIKIVNDNWQYLPYQYLA